jgi:hypothetical protein
VDTEGLDTKLPARAVLLKICGVFVDESRAEEHARSLKRLKRYQSYDLCVVAMYEWLKMPPPIDLVDKVVYDNPKLGEILGERKKPIDLPEIDEGDFVDVQRPKICELVARSDDGLTQGQRDCAAIMSELCSNP